MNYFRIPFSFVLSFTFVMSIVTNHTYLIDGLIINANEHQKATYKVGRSIEHYSNNIKFKICKTTVLENSF